MTVITCGSEILFITDNTCDRSSSCFYFYFLNRKERDGFKEKLPKFSHYFC